MGTSLTRAALGTVVWALAAAGAAAQGAQAGRPLANVLAVVDATGGGTELYRDVDGSAGATVQNGAPFWVLGHAESASGEPWAYGEASVGGPGSADVRAGFVRAADLRLYAPVRPGAATVRGAGAPAGMRLVRPGLPLAVGAGGRALALRAGPNASARVVLRVGAGDEVELVACRPRAAQAPGRWCAVVREAQPDDCEDSYCPGARALGYVSTADLALSCALQSEPGEPAHPCAGRVQSRVGPDYETAATSW